MLNFMAFIVPKAEKKDTNKFGMPMFQHLLVTWGLFATENFSKLAPTSLGPDS
jgi:hypothetical protein